MHFLCAGRCGGDGAALLRAAGKQAPLHVIECAANTKQYLFLFFHLQADSVLLGFTLSTGFSLDSAGQLKLGSDGLLNLGDVSTPGNVSTRMYAVSQRLNQCPQPVLLCLLLV